MWENYAKSIGVGANSLSKAQKRQAEYNGIMEATKFQVGDAAKYADRLGGKMLALDAQVVKIKTSFGNMIAPIVEMVLPTFQKFATGIDNVINGINKMSAPVKYAIAGAVAGVLLFAGAAAIAIPIVIGLTLVAAALDVALMPLIGTALLAGAAIVALGAATGYFFGRSKVKDVLGGIDDKLKSVKKSLTKTTEAQNGLNNSMKDANKTIGKNIQAFDELNLVQEDTASALENANNFDLSIPDLSLANMFDGLLDALDNTKAKMKENPIIIPMKYEVGSPPTLPPPDTAPITSAIQSIETMIANLKSKAEVQINIFANDYATPVINSVASTISNFAMITVPNALGQMANYMQNNWKPIVTGALLAVAAVAAFAFGGEIVAAVGLAGARLASFASTLIAEVPVLASATGAISNTFSIAMGAIGVSLVGAGLAIKTFGDETINKLGQIGIAIYNWSSESILNISKWAQNTSQNILTWSTNTGLNINTWATKTAESLGKWIEGTSSGVSLWTKNALLNFQVFSNDASTAVNKFASNAWKTLGEWLSKTATNIASWATSSIQTIVSWAQSAYSAIASLAGAIGAKINTGISWSANAIKSTFSDIGQWIGDNSNWIAPIAIGGLVVAGVAATGLTGGLAAPVAAGAIAAATSAAAVNASQIPKIPELASGGIVSSPTIAKIGEAGPEAIVPLENTSFVNTIASAIGTAVMNAIQFSQPQQSGGSGEVVVQIDSTKLARVMIPAINKEQSRIGNAIIQGV